MPEVVFPSEWLKIGVNVKQGDTVKFVDAGIIDEETERYTFQVEIYHEGLMTETKKFGLNKTNFKVISGIYGTNSDAWVGKEMIVNAVKVRNPQTGLLVDSIALSAPEKK
jgi:predicted nucleotidyltransferase